jgi:hypothetical protein
LREALILAGFALMALARTGLARDLGTRFFVGVDAIQDVWILNWVTSHAVQDPSRVFEGNNYFPAHDAILLCDPLLGPAALVLPLRLFTANPVFLYNAAVLLVLVLASWGFYRLAWKLSGDRAAALLAGFAVPYLPQQTHHMIHLNLVTLAGFPFLMLGLIRLLEEPRPAAALVTGFAFAFQAGTSGYWAFCSTILCLVVAAWSWRSFRRPAVWAHAAAAAAIAAALLAPYVLGFLRHRADADLTRPPETAAGYSVDLGRGLFLSNAYLWRAVSPGGGISLFPGLTIFGLALYGAVRSRSPYRSLLLAIAGVFLFVSLGPELRVFGYTLFPLPFAWLHEHVPLFSAIKHPVTFGVMVVTALTLLAVLGFAESGLARSPVAVTLVVLLTVVETWAPVPRRQARDTALPEVYRYLLAQPRGALLELPFEDESDHQWWSIHHGLPVVNGMAAFEPAWHVDLVQLIGREWRQAPGGQDMEDWASLKILKARVPLRYLVVHPDVSGYVRANVEATRATFEPIHDAADGSRVYRVRLGGAGRVVRRRFREDQLASGRLEARVRGPKDAVLAVSVNGAPAARQPLAADWTDAVWRVPDGVVRRGLNLVTLELEGAPPEAVFELYDISPG